MQPRATVPAMLRSMYAMSAVVAALVPLAACSKPDRKAEPAPVEQAAVPPADQAEPPATPVQPEPAAQPEQAAKEVADPAAQPADPPPEPAAQPPSDPPAQEPAADPPSKQKPPRPPPGKPGKPPPGKPSKPPSGGDPGALPGQGEPCSGGSCAQGLTCVEYYGFAGARGPKMSSCEIRCAGGKGAKGCPAGQQCVTIADGPGQVCRPH